MHDDHLITYLTAAQVRARFGGISDMALWRWLHDEELNFPEPLRIQGRRFWKAADLTAWERTRAADAQTFSEESPTEVDDAPVRAKPAPAHVGA